MSSDEEELELITAIKEFYLLGQGLDNFGDLSENELIRLKDITKMLSITTKRILEAYAYLDKEISYVQGMHCIASAIVYNFFLSMVEHHKLKSKLTLITQNNIPINNLSSELLDKFKVYE